MAWETYYKEHLCSMEELLRRLPKENVTYITSHAAGEPKAINHAIAENFALFHNVTIFNLLVVGEAPYCRPEMAGHLRYRTIFAGSDTRTPIAEKRADYVPLYYHQCPDYVRTKLKPDVAILHVSPPDTHGWCSFGVTVDFQMAAAETASLVVAQVNPLMPRTLGNCRIHISQIDYLVEATQALAQVPPARIGDVEKAIGANCAALIHDRDCLQLGIGAIPDAVLSLLGSKRELGIHSEMVSDGIVDMMEAGVITNRYKQLDVGASTATFLMGTDKLYRYAHDNPGFNMTPVDYSNDPRVICRQDNMVAVNSALQLDLFGQVAADTMGKLQFSGPGGQVDFIRGTNMSRGGRNIIAMPSTAKHGTLSRISLLLPTGSAVTTNRFDVDYVITEYGTAQLWGKTLTQRAEALISIAHPDFRDALKKEYQLYY